MLVLGPVSSAAADAPSVNDIERWAGDLRSGNAELIAAAAAHLGGLSEDALPAIEERLARTARQIVPEEDGYDALRYFRHAVGSRRADDMIDIAPGIPAVVMERPTPDVGRSAERLLLLRSLERIGTVPAQRLMGDVFALTPSMWRWERRRLLDRTGPRLLPGLLWMRAHDEPDVRRWARAAIARLGLGEPGRAVQEEDPERLAGILEAYGATREMNAMPVIISFVGHSDERVRQAARDAMNLFGRNGIWQLREGMRNQLGQEADHEWGWQRTSALLYEGLDAQRLAPVTEQLEEGLERAEAGDLVEARSLLDAVLLREPMHPRRSELALHYARFADEAGDERGALLRRALWLNPDAPEASTWESALLALDVQENEALGFDDVQGRQAVEEAMAEAPEPSAEADLAAGETNPMWLWLVVAAALALGAFMARRRLIAAARRCLRALERPSQDDEDPKPLSAETTVIVKRKTGKRWRSWAAKASKALSPSAAKAGSLLWAAARRGAAELMSLLRTAHRVLRPGTTTPRRTRTKKVASKTAGLKPPREKARRTARAKKPIVEAADTIPLSGLFFGSEEPELEGPTTENDFEADDFDATPLDATPLDLVPPALFADTSPGSIEAPDTLPG